MAVRVRKCRICSQVPGLGHQWLCCSNQTRWQHCKICSYIYSIYHMLLPIYSYSRINSQSNAFILAVNATFHIHHHVSDLQTWTNKFWWHCVIVPVNQLEKTKHNYKSYTRDNSDHNLHLTITNTLRLRIAFSKAPSITEDASYFETLPDSYRGTPRYQMLDIISLIQDVNIWPWPVKTCFGNAETCGQRKWW